MRRSRETVPLSTRIRQTLVNFIYILLGIG